MSRRLRSLASELCVILVFVSFLAVSGSSPASGDIENNKTYITLQFGRTLWVGTAKCSPFPGAVNLGAVGRELDKRGYAGVGAVVLDRTLDGSRLCWHHYSRNASWQDIYNLQAKGWSFISAGEDYSMMPTLSTEEQYAQSCGTLAEFAARGIDASGEFAYPDNKSTHAMQSEIVSTCYDWGRRYLRFKATTFSDSMEPWFQSTHSLAGGLCNDPALNCYTVAGSTKVRYQPPALVGSWLAGLKAGQWATLQGYRFVTGSSRVWPSFDCTSPDPNAHWTSQGELYCWNDYQAILDQIPATTVVTDPATVAADWGRIIEDSPTG